MTTDRRRNPVLVLTLGGLELASLLGIGYCVLALAGIQQCDLETCSLVYYGAFFSISALCVSAILRWKRWGIYGLATTTGTVALIDYLQGVSTLMDFMAVMVLIAGAGVLMRPAWQDMD